MKKRYAATILLLLGVFTGTSIGFAADRHHGHGAGPIKPIETGQDAFAAIAEIVSILEADPATDWTKVDLSALRQHLVDMNRLTLDANTDEVSLEDGLAITITGVDRTLEAIHRMVPAHAKELDLMPIWSASAETQAAGAKLVVTSDDPDVHAKIWGLGFFGLMARGSHHQDHHLAIARGEAVHQHH
ncbi:MAG: hypothetical protein OEU92_21580 [Alphaproteobacteria bacterium]|nr:hypothetical protein [Alphaproteobacteria bacterium]